MTEVVSKGVGIREETTDHKETIAHSGGNMSSLVISRTSLEKSPEEAKRLDPRLGEADYDTVTSPQDLSNAGGG